MCHDIFFKLLGSVCFLYVTNKKFQYLTIKYGFKYKKILSFFHVQEVQCLREKMQHMKLNHLDLYFLFGWCIFDCFCKLSIDNYICIPLDTKSSLCVSTIGGSTRCYLFASEDRLAEKLSIYKHSVL